MKTNLATFLAAAALAGLASPAQAQSAIDLGAASSFAVLGGTTITSIGGTIITGDVGVYPGATITMNSPGVVNGTSHNSDATAIAAHNAASAAFTTLAGETATMDLTGQDLGGLTLTTGVYSFGAAAQLTGTLTLNALGDPTARFDFLIGSTLTTAMNSQITFINGASAENVFWNVGSSATLGGASIFGGNILALTSITANTGAAVDGRLLAINGAVSLDSNAVAVPEPATTAVLIAGFAGLFVAVRGLRRRHAPVGLG